MGGRAGGMVGVRVGVVVWRVTDRKPIWLIIELLEWKKDEDYDRTGLFGEYEEILDVKVTYIRIPVRPGRNIAIIVEVAALNHRLKELGLNPAEELNKRILAAMNGSL